MNREIFDIALVVIIALFMFLKAALLERKSRLGLSMVAYNLVLGASFLASIYIRTVLGLTEANPRVSLFFTIDRIVIAITVAWGCYELIRARWAVIVIFKQRVSRTIIEMIRGA